jgi:hypothetical protein
VTVEAPRCIKCGREIAAGESMCEICNRAGMATPSASQYHGTIAVAVVLAVAALALGAGLTLRGIGPWTAAVAGAEADGSGAVAVTLTVTNEGSSSGRAKCRIVARGDRGEVLRSRNFVTAAIGGGASSSVVESVPGLPDVPPTIDVACE